MIVPEEKSIFKIHSQDIRFLYQLRTGLSPLRAHKYRHDFLDTPNDICICQSEIESATHFFLYYPLFNDHRPYLMEKNLTINCEFFCFTDDSKRSNIILYYIRNTGRLFHEVEFWLLQGGHDIMKTLFRPK